MLTWSIGDLIVTLEENLFGIEGFLEDGTPFSIKNLNYAVRDIINAKKNSAYTKAYFESLHKQYPNGISYKANGTPDVRTIAARTTGGKITTGNTGEVIEVDLSDPTELKELKLDKKIDGLTQIESELEQPV